MPSDYRDTCGRCAHIERDGEREAECRAIWPWTRDELWRCELTGKAVDTYSSPSRDGDNATGCMDFETRRRTRRRRDLMAPTSDERRCQWCALFDPWGRGGWCFALASEVGDGDSCPEFRRFLHEGSDDAE